MWDAVVALPDDTTLLATGADDGTARLWDPYTGEPVGEPIALHDARVTAMAVASMSGGHSLLAIGFDDGTLGLWDPATGRAVAELASLDRGNGFLATVLTTVDVPDGRTLLACCGYGNVVLWDLTSREQVGRLPIGHAETTAVAPVAHVGGRMLLATVSRDASAQLWDPVTARPVGQPLNGHSSAVTSIAAIPLPDGRIVLATGSYDTTVRLWATASGPTEQTRQADEITGFARIRLPNERTVLATADWNPATAQATVRLRDIATGSPVGRSLTGIPGKLIAITQVQRADGQSLLAIGGDDRTVRLWDPSTGEQVGAPLTGHTDSVTALATVRDPDGGRMLVSLSDNVLRRWNLASGAPLGRPRTGRNHWVLDMVAVRLPDGSERLATRGLDGLVRLLEPPGLRPVRSRLRRVELPHRNSLTCLAALELPPGRTLLATGTDMGDMRLWEPATGELIGRPFRGHSGSVNAIVVVPADRLIATGGSDGTVQLWQLDSHRPVATIVVDNAVLRLTVVGTALAVGMNTGVAVIDLNLALTSSNP